MRPFRTLSACAWLLGAGLLLFVPRVAAARPGGGNTYRSSPSSGASRSSGSSSRSSGSTGSTRSSGTSSRASSGSGRSAGARVGYVPGSGSSGDRDATASADLFDLLANLSPRQFLALVGGIFVVLFVSSAGASRRQGRRVIGWTTSRPDPPPDEKAALDKVFEDARQAALARGPSPYRPSEIERVRLRVRDVPQAIRVLGGKDEDFSVPVFEDFVTALYHAANERRGTGRLHELAPYIAHSAQVTYDALPAERVEAIVVGTVSDAAIFAVTAPVREIEAQIVFSANYTETDKLGTEKRYVLNELWTLLRSPDISSRAPTHARVIGCPKCGAPIGARGGKEPTVGDPCPHCRELVDPGAFDWRVVDIRVRYREVSDALALGDVEEVGTDFPTVIDPDALVALEALQTRDPSQTWPALVARVVLVFDTFLAAWTKGDLTPMRPFLTDTLFQAQTRFLDAYKRRKLENHTVDGRTSFIELARVTRDRHYDSITLRVHASALDYTLDAKGVVVGGSRSKRREYTEYWTFLRAAAHTGPPRVELSCPSCGGTVEVNMAGRCAHCAVKITRGDFDWVLSRIEQDESYRV